MTKPIAVIGASGYIGSAFLDELKRRRIPHYPVSGLRLRNVAGGFPVETAAEVALRTVRDHLLGETGIERVTFVLRQGAFETFKRRLAAI
jgi:uncharacterized protein YbjT (DUF2867 family)